MSYQEKSILISLVTTLVVWGLYFHNVFQVTRAGALSIGAVGGLLLGAVIVTVIVEIVGQALIAARTAIKAGSDDVPAEDERDRAILHRASYYASYILSFGVIATVIVALVTKDLALSLNTLILHFIAGEVWRYVTQLLYYRRGF